MKQQTIYKVLSFTTQYVLCLLLQWLWIRCLVMSAMYRSGTPARNFEHMPARALMSRVLAACAVVTLCAAGDRNAQMSEAHSGSSCSSSSDSCSTARHDRESENLTGLHGGLPLTATQRVIDNAREIILENTASHFTNIGSRNVHGASEPHAQPGEAAQQDLNLSAFPKLDLSETESNKQECANRFALISKNESPREECQSVQSDPEGFKEAQTLAIDRAIHAAVVREMASRSTLMPLNMLLHTFRRVVGITLTFEPLNYDAISLANCIQTVVLVNRFLRTSLLSEPVADGIRLYFLIFWLFGMRAILMYLAYISFGVWQNIDGFFASRTFAILMYTHLLPVVLFISDAIEYIDVARRDREPDNRLTDAEINEALNQELYAANITDPDLACSMCLHRLQRSHLILCRLRCGHIYHRVCIREWIKEYNSSGCPVCRTNVLPNMESSDAVQDDQR